MRTKVNPIKYCITTLLFTALISTAFANNRNIVIIHSYAADFVDWVPAQESGFKSVLGDNYKYHTFYMNTKHIPEKDFVNKSVEALDFIENKNPILVYLTDDNALNWVGRHINKRIPVVFSGINAFIREEYPWVTTEHNNITGVMERPLIKRTLLLMQTAIGADISKVLMPMGTSATANGMFFNDLKGKEIFSVSNGTTHVRRSPKFEDWKTWIKASKKEGYTAISPNGIYALEDSNGKRIDAAKITRWISENSPLPVFSIHDTFVGKGMFTGAYGLSGIIMGEDAGEIAREILEEEKPLSKISPKIQNRGQLVFSQTELNKYNLTISPAYIGKSKLVD